MTLFRRRVLFVCVATLAMLAGTVVWSAPRANESSQTATSAAPSESTESNSSTTSPSTTSPSTTIVPGAKSSRFSGSPVSPPTQRIDPKVDADIAAVGSTEVLVTFDAQPVGSDDEKRAEVRSGIDAITSALPPGSWSIVSETPTVPVANLVIDASALAVIDQLSGIQRVQSALTEFFPAEIADGIGPTSDLAPSATTSTMGAEVAWAAGFKGAGTTIAVIDTGVQIDHPYLMNGTVQKTVGEACFAGAPGYKSTCPDGVPMAIDAPSKVGAGAPCPIDIIQGGQKECSHGTHVAGIAAGGNGTGTSGIAPGASLISIQVFAYNYSTNRLTADSGDIDAALQWLYNRRADFPNLTAVNLSLAGSLKYPDASASPARITFCDSDYPSTKYRVQQLRELGIATVVASGNDSWTDGVAAPACLSNVVTVSALSGGSGDVRAPYANVGPQVNLFAPGTLTSSIPCNGSGVLSGTSMATPAVAGSIALLRQGSVADTVSLLEDTGTTVSGFPSVKLDRALVGLPGPPRLVNGLASGSSVALSWLAPQVNAGTVADYTVTASPGGQTCTTSGLSCTISSLDTTKSYVFTIVATGTGGVGAGASTPSIPLANVPVPPTDYVSLVPARLLDTRSVASGASTIDGNDLGCGAVGQGVANVRTLVVEGRGGVPTSGVDAVALNVTIAAPTASSFLSVYAGGTTTPGTSSINFVAGQIVPNMVIVKVGTDGRINILNALGSTQVVVDVVGWFPDGSDYTGVDPQRLLDTRTAAEGGGPTVAPSFQGIGPVGPRQTLKLPVIGRGTIPATGVGAVALNVTAVSPTGSSFLTVYPFGAALPNASNLNFTAGQTVANMVIAKVGADGSISIYNALGSTQVLVDIVGWFPPEVPPPAVSEYTGIVPERFLDTRTCNGCFTIDDEFVGIGPVAPQQSLPLQITGRGSIPSSGVGSVALNVTGAGSSASSYLTVYPFGAARPTASNLNFLPGQVVPNMVIVKLGADGQIAIFNAAGSTSVVVDVVGWFPG
ncbi:MAG: S8 family serine peptidase [Actinomycetes bacterium]